MTPPEAVRLIDVRVQVSTVVPELLVIRATGAVFGAAVPEPAGLVQPFTVWVTV